MPEFTIPYKPFDPMQIFAQAAAIKGAQSQNALADFKLKEAQDKEGVLNAMRGLNPNDPDFDAKAWGIDPITTMAIRKHQREGKAADALTGLRGAQTTNAKLDGMEKGLAIASHFANEPRVLIGVIDQHKADVPGLDVAREKLVAAAGTPEYPALAQQFFLNAKEKLDAARADQEHADLQTNRADTLAVSRGHLAEQQHHNQVVENKPDAGAEQITLDPDAVNLFSDMVNNGQNLPPMGYGKSAAAARQAIYNEAARKARERARPPPTDPESAVPGAPGPGVPATIDSGAGDIGAAKAERSTSTQALGAMERQRNIAEAQIAAATKGFGIIRENMTKVDNTGIPFVQSWINAGRRKTGDPNITALDNAVAVAKNEYAKVMSGATGAAGITEGARQEADRLFDSAQSIPQLEAAMRTAESEMRTRSKAYLEQSQKLRGSVRDIGRGTPAPASAPKTEGTPQKEFDSMPMASKYAGKRITTPEGIAYISDGSKWVRQ